MASKQSWANGLVLGGCAALGVVHYWRSEPIAAKELLTTIVPAWLQGLGTLGAALLALSAYRIWGRQERARRQAKEAEVMLDTAYALLWAIRQAKGLARLYKLPLKLVDVRIETGVTVGEKLQHSERFAQELAAHMDKTEAIYDGEDVEKVVRALLSIHTEISNARFRLQRMVDLEDDMESSRSQEIAVKCLRTLGHREWRVSREIWETGFAPDDEIENRLAEHFPRLMGILKKKIRFEG